jgi:hypothetical protein
MRIEPGQWLRQAALTLAMLALACVLIGTYSVVEAQCPASIAANSGLEDGYSTRGAGEVQVANGWQPWYQDGPRVGEGYFKRPEWKPENASIYGTRRVHGGNWAQKWFTVYGTHNAGIFQQVSVPAGSTVTASAWFQSWSSDADDITRSEGNYRTYIGIDPTGGTNALSGTVVWSPVNQATDRWVQQGVQAQAQGGTVTVFLRGEPEFRTKHNDAYVDDICVQVSAPAVPPTATPRPTNTTGPTLTPGPTFTPAPTMTATPTATAEPTPTAEPSGTPETTATPTPGPEVRIIVSAFEDLNGDGSRDGDEGLLAGVLVELLDAGDAEIASHRTTGKTYTFEGLQPGTYTLVISDAAGYRATGPGTIELTLVPRAARELAIGQKAIPPATQTLERTAAVPAATKEPEATLTATPQSAAAPLDTPRATLGGAGKPGFFQRYGGLILAAIGLGIGIPAATRLFGKRGE